MDFDLALQRQLSDRQRKQGKTERIYSRKMIEQAFLESFEMVGGIPRLCIWANDPENYGTFLSLLMKIAPKEAMGQQLGQVLEYRSNIPQRPNIEDTEEGLIITDEPQP